MNIKKIIALIASSMALFTVAGLSHVTSITSVDASAKTTKTYKSKLSSANVKAKNWIAWHESRGSYRARNGRYIGRYQLSSAYLKGDWSKANQERTADRYVKARYGSWVNAKRHWITIGWY